MEEEAIAIKKNTLWKVLVGLFVILFIIALIWNPFGGSNTGEVITGEATGNTLQEQMCSSIRGTPAWADSEGVVADYGYRETYSVDDLIADKTYFIYNPGCGWCQKQITFFGEEWQKYIDSGYTVDCSSL
jgi:hypothetical protein